MEEKPIELDLKDKKILYELEKNARQSNKVIGRKVGVRGDLVRYRINKLVEKKVIHSFLSFVNFSKLGYTDYGIFFNVRNLTKEKESKLIEFIKNYQYTTYFARVGGKYDFVLGLLSKDILHFHEVFSKIANKFGDNISNKDISIRMALFHFPKKYLTVKKESSENLPSFGGKLEAIKLDKLDKKILEVISNDSRSNVIDISKKINAPASTISLRIKKMSKNKIIKGFFTFIDSSKYGFDNYNLLMSLSNMPKVVEDKFYGFCKSHKNISWLIKTIGPWDYEIGVEAPDKETFQRLLSEIREKFSNHITNLDFVTIFEERSIEGNPVKFQLYELK